MKERAKETMTKPNSNLFEDTDASVFINADQMMNEPIKKGGVL